MSKEAMKLALEALEFIPKSGSMLGTQAETKRLQAIAVMKEALVMQQISEPCRCGKQTNAWCMANTCSKAQQALDKKAENARELGLDYEPAQQEPVAYPEGDVVGPCICGSWPGGKCLKCPRITTPAQDNSNYRFDPPGLDPSHQKPVAWVYPEGLEALKAGKPWTAYGTRQEPNNTALYLSPQPDIAPYAWVTFTPYGDEDDVWYENPEGKLIEGWTYKPLYDTTPPAQRTWVGLTDEEIARVVSLAGFSPDWAEAHIATQIVRVLEAKLKEKNA